MILERRDLLLRSEDLRLEVLQLLGDEALRIREGLLADVALGYLVAPAVAHLDVVAEDLVVADLECLDPRARALTFLHLLQERFAVARNGVQFVERRVIARADDAALAYGQPRLIDNRTLQRIAQLVEGLNCRVRTRKKAAHRRTECFTHGRKCSERDAECNKVACICCLRFNARQKALEVIDRTQVFTQTSAQ